MSTPLGLTKSRTGSSASSAKSSARGVFTRARHLDKKFTRYIRHYKGKAAWTYAYPHRRTRCDSSGSAN
jgi:hypothetical protein